MSLATNFLLESQYAGQVDNSSSGGAGSSHVPSCVFFLHFYVHVFTWSLSVIPKYKELNYIRFSYHLGKTYMQQKECSSRVL